MDERRFLIEGFCEVLNNVQEIPSKFKQWQFTLEESLYIHEEHEEFSEEDSRREVELDGCNPRLNASQMTFRLNAESQPLSKTVNEFLSPCPSEVLPWPGGCRPTG